MTKLSTRSLHTVVSSTRPSPSAFEGPVTFGSVTLSRGLALRAIGSLREGSRRVAYLAAGILICCAGVISPVGAQIVSTPGDYNARDVYEDPTKKDGLKTSKDAELMRREDLYPRSPINIWPDNIGDTAVDPEELNFLSAEELRMIDENRDGVIDRRELDAHQRAIEQDPIFGPGRYETKKEEATKNKESWWSTRPSTFWLDTRSYPPVNREELIYSDPVENMPAPSLFEAREGSAVYRSDVAEGAIFPTGEDGRLFQRDRINDNAAASSFWKPGIWDGQAKQSFFERHERFFTPIDNVLAGALRGPSYSSVSLLPSGQRATMQYDEQANLRGNRFYRGTGGVDLYHNSGGVYVYPDSRGTTSGPYSQHRRPSRYAPGAQYVREFGGEGGVLSVEGNANIGLSQGVGIPISFDPRYDDTAFRIGPLILADLSVYGSLLYTEFNGTPSAYFDEGVDPDGWISIVGVSTRLLFQISQSAYISGSIAGYYLPGEGEFGWGIPGGLNAGLFGVPLTWLRIGYDTEIAGWEVTFFDEPAFGYDLDNSFNFGLEGSEFQSNIAEVGRYSFGTASRRSNDLRSSSSADFVLDSENLIFRNTLGAAASKVFHNEWGVLFRADREDFWDTDGFDDHSDRFTARARAEYVGGRWRTKPFAEYVFTAEDEFDSRDHYFWVGARSQIAATLEGWARVGYFWSETDDDLDSWLAEGALIHQLGPWTTQSLSGGRTVDDSGFRSRQLADYIRYVIYQELGFRTWLELYGQIAKVDEINGYYDDRDSWQVGLNARHDLTDALYLSGSALYEDNDYARNEEDNTIWIFRLGLGWDFLPDWTLYTYYQYTDEAHGDPDYTFTESVWMATIKWDIW